MRVYWTIMAGLFVALWAITLVGPPGDELRDIASAARAVPFLLCLRWATE